MHFYIPCSKQLDDWYILSTDECSNFLKDLSPHFKALNVNGIEFCSMNFENFYKKSFYGLEKIQTVFTKGSYLKIYDAITYFASTWNFQLIPRNTFSLKVIG